MNGDKISVTSLFEDEKSRLWIGSTGDLRVLETGKLRVIPELSQKTGDAIIAVRLVNKKTRRNVSDAIMVATRIDMAPDGMAAMTSPIELLPTTEPGIYRFKTKLSMAGGWRLSLAAKVQGETGTVESRLILKAIE